MSTLAIQVPNLKWHAATILPGNGVVFPVWRDKNNDQARINARLGI